jgi:bifunctional UDP-N-acetylglucosamine pyrophosphorylase/glucosamine-1-phosphate N-acetyltransferase
LNLAVVVLAAGEGTRMHSRRPKVLHRVAGLPMVVHVVRTSRTLNPRQVVVVVGYERHEVQDVLGNDVAYADQPQQLGTAHAVLQARPHIDPEVDTVLAVYGDAPLITADTLNMMLQRHITTQATITMLTTHIPDPTGYGRIIRDGGQVVAIVEEAVATSDQKALTEINPGFYLFDSDWLWSALERVEPSPAGEYYLTDLAELAGADGRVVDAVVAADAQETLGVNTRAQLADAEAILRERIRQRWLGAGVTLVDPPSTWIDADVTIGVDTEIHPNTYLQGQTTIGEECSLGPGTLIRDSIIGDRCRVVFSTVEEATLHEGVDVGPYSHLRRGASLGPGVHVGNFGEIKNSTLGTGVKMGHFSYLGDATVGDDVNIGAGTITCNYDGQRKHATIIEAGAFIGSDTMLVAPVTIGAGARTGAGAVVVRDIPADSLAYGVPARIRSDGPADDTPSDSETGNTTGPEAGKTPNCT